MISEETVWYRSSYKALGTVCRSPIHLWPWYATQTRWHQMSGYSLHLYLKHKKTSLHTLRWHSISLPHHWAIEVTCLLTSTGGLGGGIWGGLIAPFLFGAFFRTGARGLGAGCGWVLGASAGAGGAGVLGLEYVATTCSLPGMDRLCWKKELLAVKREKEVVGCWGLIEDESYCDYICALLY